MYRRLYLRAEYVIFGRVLLSMGRQEVRILVIHEQDDYFKLVSSHAEDYLHGYEVSCTHAESGKAARSLLSKWLPTIIILDAYLDDVNSVEILKEFQGEHLPVIVTSEHFSSEIDRSAKEHGACAYLVAEDTQHSLETLFGKIAELSSEPAYTH